MLRPAIDADRDLMLAWRNHPDVRALSLTRHVISPAEHAAWWDRTLADPTRRVLVYERYEVPSGAVTFFDRDAAEGSAWWGYYLDVAGLAARGALMPAWISIVREALRYAVEEMALTVLYGEVLEANEAVRSFNRRNGIREVDSYSRDVDGRSETVIRLEFRATDLRRPAGASR
ncbi:MAG: GNAT family N-acetyltransferase [Frankiaceae bacterium]